MALMLYPRCSWHRYINNTSHVYDDISGKALTPSEQD